MRQWVPLALAAVSDVLRASPRKMPLELLTPFAEMVVVE
jgi:hypothetical protein